MSTGSNRRGLGCFIIGSLAFTLFVACIAGGCGLLLGLYGIRMEFGPGVAVLDVFGEIADGQAILEQLDTLVKNPDTRAVVVRVDSPGGVITVVEEIYNALKRAAGKGIPIVASMGATSASGGYFVCLAAECIFANRSSLTGSIGVLVEYASAHDLFEKLGIKFDTVASGEFKALGSISEPLTERERQHVQNVVDDFHQFFVETLSAARHLEIEQARALADGRVFTGRQALDVGLVDQIGDLDDAVRYAAQRAGIPGEPRVIRVQEKGFSLLALLDRLSSAAGASLGRRGWAPKFVMR
jgi:protease-4